MSSSYSSDIVFKNNLELDLGGLKVILKNVVSPHSKDLVIVYIPEEKIVFIEDAYGMDYYNNCEYNAVKLESLINMLESLEFDVCFPGHSSSINKTKIIEYLKSQHKKILVGNE